MQRRVGNFAGLKRVFRTVSLGTSTVDGCGEPTIDWERPVADIYGVAYHVLMHVVGSQNYPEALDAIRDILMLYVDLADSTQGFGHNADTYVRFDRLKFVDAQVESDGYHYVDLELLRAGSAIAIVCVFYDLWCEDQPLSGHPASERYEVAIAGGRLSHFPDIEAVLRDALNRKYLAIDDPWFEHALNPIYRKYVCGFFERLAQGDRFDG